MSFASHENNRQIQHNNGSPKPLSVVLPNPPKATTTTEQMNNWTISTNYVVPTVLNYSISPINPIEISDAVILDRAKLTNEFVLSNNRTGMGIKKDVMNNVPYNFLMNNNTQSKMDNLDYQSVLALFPQEFTEPEDQKQVQHIEYICNNQGGTTFVALADVNTLLGAYKELRKKH